MENTRVFAAIAARKAYAVRTVRAKPAFLKKNVRTSKHYESHEVTDAKELDKYSGVNLLKNKQTSTVVPTTERDNYLSPLEV